MAPAYFQSLIQSGSRIGCRGGSSNSTPPSGSQIDRMCFTRSAPVFGLLGLSRALFRISRASCSIDRPFSAARIFSRCFNFSSSFRTVMLAMQSMIAMLAMIAQGLFAPQDRERDTRAPIAGDGRGVCHYTSHLPCRLLWIRMGDCRRCPCRHSPRRYASLALHTTCTPRDPNHACP